MVFVEVKKGKPMREINFVRWNHLNVVSGSRSATTESKHVGTTSFQKFLYPPDGATDLRGRLVSKSSNVSRNPRTYIQLHLYADGSWIETGPQLPYLPLRYHRLYIYVHIRHRRWTTIEMSVMEEYRSFVEISHSSY